MSLKTESITVATLALAAAGVWASVAHRTRCADGASEPEPAASDASSGVVPAPQSARTLSATSLSVGLPTAGQWRGRPALADVDGDGALDLVASVRVIEGGVSGEGLYVWLGDGAGNWRPSVAGLRREMGYGGSALFDVDGDGALDVAFSGHGVTPQVFLGDGAGAWRSAGAGIGDWGPLGPCSDVALGDLDGDGVAELATLGFFSESGGLYLYSRAASGTWEPRAQVCETARFGSQVEMIDLDGDGRCELLATTDEGPRVWRLVDGELVDQSAGLPAPEVGGSDLGIDAADLDGDGVAELVVSGMLYPGHAPLALYRWSGELWESFGAGLPADEACFDVRFADLDGKGAPELVVAGRMGISVITMTSPARFERLGRIEGTEGVINVGIGDVDGDRLDEVVFVGFSGVRVLDLLQALGGTL